jgi:hypothetical protein
VGDIRIGTVVAVGIVDIGVGLASDTPVGGVLWPAVALHGGLNHISPWRLRVIKP